jgi:hypothetical protein
VHAPEGVPLWMPTSVRSDVVAWLKNPNYREHPNDLAILLRLATDLRMQKVWRVLEGKPPAKLRHFFVIAYTAAVHPRTVITAKYLDGEAAKAFAAADINRWTGHQAAAADADKLARAMWERSRKLGADQPVALSPSGWRPPSLVVLKEHKEDERARGYVLELSDATRMLFGNVNLRTVATTASVALQRRITARHVQEWIKQASPSPPSTV